MSGSQFYSSASPVSTTTITSSRATRSRRILLQQSSQSSSWEPTELYAATAAQGPAIGGRRNSFFSAKSLEATNYSTTDRQQYSRVPTYAGGAMGSPALGLSQAQHPLSDQEAAMIGGSRPMEVPTPTSTSSYGARDDGKFSMARARRESDFGSVDDGYGSAMIGNVPMSDPSMQGQMSPEYVMGAGDYEGGGDVLGDAGDGEGNDGEDIKMKMEGDGHDQTQTWSETKTKAGKERKRLPLACIMCRRKKIRCSGEKPACKHCLRSRIPCVYKQTARKTVPRTDYMTMLDRRLKRMEERLLKDVPKDEINALIANTGRSVVKPSISSAGKKRSAGAAFDEELESWSQPGPRVAIQRSIDGAGQKPPKTDPDDGFHALPSKEIQEHLAEVFFDCVYGQPYFLLHKPSFLRRLRNGTAPPVLVLAICALSARFSNHPAVRHEPPFLAGENFATEARRQVLKNFDNPNLTNLTVCLILGLHEFGTCQGGRSWAFGGMATRMAHALQLHKEADEDPMERALFRPDYIHEGGLLGGYMSFTDKEIRRRCMWACFVMDRFSSSGTERPCVINESEVEIQLPVHDRNLQLEVPAITEQLDGGVKDNPGIPEEEKLAKAAKNMGIGAYIVRVVAIYGRVVKYLNQGGKQRDPHEIWESESHFAELNSEIRNFLNDLPAKFQYTEDNLQRELAEKTLSQFVFMHVGFHQIRLFLHWSSLTVPGTPTNGQTCGMPRDFVTKAGGIALDAATRIAEILFDAQQQGVLVAAPFTGYCAFNASLVHLVRMFRPQKDVQSEAKKHMETCLKFLLQIRQYWGLFRSITDSLKILYRRFSENSTGTSSILGHQEASRVLQYGDWFMKYPQGIPPGEIDDGPTKRNAENGRPPPEDPALSHRPDLQTADEFFARLGPRADGRHSRATPATSDQGFVQSTPGAAVGIQHTMLTTPASQMQHPAGLHSPPAPMSTPTMMQAGRMPQTHGLSPGQQAQTSPSYPSRFRPQNEPPPMSSPLTPHMHASHQFQNYPAQSLPPTSFVPPPHQQQLQPQQYLYDSYPHGSDVSLIAALSTGLWQGFDQTMGMADVPPFPEQISSAWFVPFNSAPPGYDAEPTSTLDALEMMESDGDGAGGGRGGGGGGGGGNDRQSAVMGNGPSQRSNDSGGGVISANGQVM